MQWFSRVRSSLYPLTTNPKPPFFLFFSFRILVATENGRCGSRTDLGKVLLPTRGGGRRSLATGGFGEGFSVLLDVAFEVDPACSSSPVLKSPLRDIRIAPRLYMDTFNVDVF